MTNGAPRDIAAADHPAALIPSEVLQTRQPLLCLPTPRNPKRASSKMVGAHFGLTPKRYQSGETDVAGGISKVGDAMVRTALYEAANAVLSRPVRFSGLKRWAMEVAKRRGLKRAKVALARKLACILHRMWLDGTEFCWGKEA